MKPGERAGGVSFLDPGACPAPPSGGHPPVPDGPCVLRRSKDRDRALVLLSPWIRAGLPWVVLAPVEETMAWLSAGAWAVLPENLPDDIAAACAGRLFEKVRSARDESPLTGLPGNTRIAAALRSAIDSGGASAAYVDITDFKPFNDYYGFARGDAVIRALSEILEASGADLFVGHIGGDDFICAGPRERLELAMASVREEFRSRAPAFYSEHDRMRGGIETLDRYGRFRFFPFVDICVVIIDLERGMTLERLARDAGIAKKASRGDLVPATLSDMILSRADGERDQAGDAERGYAGIGSDWLRLMDFGSYGYSDAKAVVEAAGVTGDRRASSLLEGILDGDLPPGLRKSAALSLGSLASPGSSDILRRSVRDPSPHVRTRSVQALALSGDADSPQILESCLDDPNTWVRRAALVAVGARRTPNAAGLLLGRLERPARGTRDDFAERSSALEGLALLADRAAFAPLALIGSRPDPGRVDRGALWKAIAASGGDEGALMICRAAPGERDAALALHWINPAALSPGMLRMVEETASGLLTTECRLPAMRCLAGLPGRGGRVLQSAVDHLAGGLDGYEFGLAVTVMEKRGLRPGNALLARVAAASSDGRLEYRNEDIVALIRLAASTGTLPGAFLPLMRSRRREVALAAARAALHVAQRLLAQKQTWCRRRESNPHALSDSGF